MVQLDLRGHGVLLSDLVGEVRDRHLLHVDQLKEVGVDHVDNTGTRVELAASRGREVSREVDEVGGVDAADTDHVLNEVRLVRVLRQGREAHEVELRILVVTERVVVHHDDVRATVRLASELRALTVQLADLADAVRGERSDLLRLVEVEVRLALGDVLNALRLVHGSREVEQAVRHASANTSRELTVEGREASKLRAVDGDARRRTREQVLLVVDREAVHRHLGVGVDELDRAETTLVLEEFLLRDVDRENNTVELDLVLLALLVPSHVQRLIAVEDAGAASGRAGHDRTLDKRTAVGGDAALLLKGTEGGDVLVERADHRTLEVGQRGIEEFNRNRHELCSCGMEEEEECLLAFPSQKPCRAEAYGCSRWGLAPP